MNIIKVYNWLEVPRNYTGVVEYPEGAKEWRVNGNLHREDGPACQFSDETELWFLEGERYNQIYLKDYVILDHYQGKHNLMWYNLLGKDEIINLPDIPGLITK